MNDLSPAADKLRRAVSDTYAHVAAPCTGPLAAGYAEEQLRELPSDAAEDFYGCGNPLAFAEVRPGQTVLDLGSGAGLDLVLAGHAVGPTGRVIGVDMTDAMIARARKNIARAGLTNVEIRSGIIEKLPVDDASVDWVISNCVISLSPEKQRVFDEVSRVLKPGGKMVISDIVVDDKLERILRLLTHVAPSIALARTEAHYLAAMRASGLVDVDVKSRHVYEADHLVGMFGDAIREGAAEACPVASLATRVRTSATANVLLRAVARQVAGHVSSSKFSARKP